MMHLVQGSLEPPGEFLRPLVSVQVVTGDGDAAGGVGAQGEVHVGAAVAREVEELAVVHHSTVVVLVRRVGLQVHVMGLISWQYEMKV